MRRFLLMIVILSGYVLAAERPIAIDRLLAGADRPWVVAHRGVSSQAPENTLAAFRRAIELGCDMVELDVLLTADGEVICLHDDGVARTTDGTGKAVQMTWAEVGRLDAGSWFGPQFSGEPVPRLAEVLDLARGRILVNIEIKKSAVTDQVAGGIVDRVITLVRERQMQDQVLLSSFEPRALLHARQLDPEIHTLSISRNAPRDRAAYLERIETVGASGMVLRKNAPGRRLLESCPRSSCFLAVYTVNDEDALRRWVDSGVAAIYTDHPERLLTLSGM